MEKHSQKIRSLYKQFTGKNLSILDDFYAKTVQFRDPVQSVTGLEDLKKYYAKAYEHVKTIEFEFSDIFNEGLKYSASWRMDLSVNGLNSGNLYQVYGTSIICFNSQGLIQEHRDYLDLGEMLYERIPIQGYFISKIKQRLKT
jgi:hypothetical protein